MTSQGELEWWAFFLFVGLLNVFWGGLSNQAIGLGLVCLVLSFIQIFMSYRTFKREMKP